MNLKTVAGKTVELAWTSAGAREQQITQITAIVKRGDSYANNPHGDMQLFLNVAHTMAEVMLQNLCNYCIVCFEPLPPSQAPAHYPADGSVDYVVELDNFVLRIEKYRTEVITEGGQSVFVNTGYESAIYEVMNMLEVFGL